MAEPEKQSIAQPEKQSIKEQLTEITARIESGIKDLFKSDKFAEYLKTMSRFHNYSVNNTMLIFMQKPNATVVAGFNKWRDQFERHVKKGEKGIKILAPSPYKKKISVPKLDPDTDLPIKDKEGNIVYEEKTITIPSYKPVPVFDVSQTYGKPLPTIATTLEGSVKHFDAFMEAIKRSAPVPIGFKPLEEKLDGFFDASAQSITLRENMSEIQTVCAAIHETAHAKLHNYEKQKEAEAKKDETAEKPVKKDRRTEEVEAESVAFAVCAYFGIKTDENSFGYIASWSSDNELPELKSSLDTIRKAASEIINDIEDTFEVICKEQGIELTAEAEPMETTNVIEEIGEAIKEQGETAKETADDSKTIETDKKAPESDRQLTIYQVKDSPETAEMMFMNFAYMKNHDLAVDLSKYNAVYSCPMDKSETLDSVFTKFNIDRPADFKGHSLSVSDVISVKENGKEKAFFVDSFGFRQLPDFFKGRQEVQEKKPSVLK